MHRAGGALEKKKNEPKNPRMVCAERDHKEHLIQIPLPWAGDTFLYIRLLQVWAPAVTSDRKCFLSYGNTIKWNISVASTLTRKWPELVTMNLEWALGMLQLPGSGTRTQHCPLALSRISSPFSSSLPEITRENDEEGWTVKKLVLKKQLEYCTAQFILYLIVKRKTKSFGQREENCSSSSPNCPVPSHNPEGFS